MDTISLSHQHISDACIRARELDEAGEYEAAAASLPSSGADSALSSD